MQSRYTTEKLELSIDNSNITINYLNWGDSQAPKIICVHGLVRNARDFDYLANDLASNYNVICIDMPGRGDSHSLVNYKLYQDTTYLQVIYELLDVLQIENCDWIGSSMGGLLGMYVAAKNPNLIQNLVLNDIGPYVPFEPLSKIASYVNLYPSFSSLEESKQYSKRILQGFGIFREEDWDYINRNSFALREDNLYYQKYDPQIVRRFTEIINSDLDLWDTWDEVNSNILIVRGKGSRILLEPTTNRMLQRDRTEIIELDNTGHTPSLMNRYEIEFIKSWLFGKRN